MVSTIKLQELVNNFSKVTGYKINIQKATIFPYVSNKQSDKKYEVRISPTEYV